MKRFLLAIGIFLIFAIVGVAIYTFIRFPRGDNNITTDKVVSRPYRCVNTCLTPEEEVLIQQKIVDTCKGDDCARVRKILIENDCDSVKKLLQFKPTLLVRGSGGGNLG
jgi:hypothetical protein